jgi:ABC-type enterobactin transport system permease subunit
LSPTSVSPPSRKQRQRDLALIALGEGNARALGVAVERACRVQAKPQK